MRVLRIVAVVLLWFPASAVIRQLEPSPSDASEFSESYGLYPVSTTQQLNAATVRIDSRGGGASTSARVSASLRTSSSPRHT